MSYPNSRHKPDYKAQAIYFAITLLESSGKIRSGEYDTMALSHLVEAGDFLVREGIFEQVGTGYGRRKFYKFVGQET